MISLQISVKKFDPLSGEIGLSWEELYSFTMVRGKITKVSVSTFSTNIPFAVAREISVAVTGQTKSRVAEPQVNVLTSQQISIY